MTTVNSLRPQKLFFAIALATGLVACGEREPSPAPTTTAPASTEVPTSPQMADPVVSTVPAVTVTKVDLGNAVGSDLAVANPSKTFKSSDTIYAAISTEGRASNVALKTRWRYQDGSVVNTTTQLLNTVDKNAITDFKIANAAGWPPGKYTVEVSVDGKSISTSEFTVVP